MTAADAELCVKAVRAETPELRGLHGVGQGRDVGIVLEIGSPAFVQSTVDAVVILMIEKKDAIDNLASILAVPGVDMVQFGPADYAMSTGLPNNKQHPAIREAEEYMIETAQRIGVTPRAEVEHPGLAPYYLERGVRHFCMGTDVRILYNWYKDTGRSMREMFAGLEHKPYA